MRHIAGASPGSLDVFIRARGDCDLASRPRPSQIITGAAGRLAGARARPRGPERGAERGLHCRPGRAAAAGTSASRSDAPFHWGGRTAKALELSFAILGDATQSQPTDLVCLAFCAEVVARLDAAGFVLSHRNIALWLLTALGDQSL